MLPPNNEIAASYLLLPLGVTSEASVRSSFHFLLAASQHMMGCGSVGEDGADGRKVPVVAAGVSRSVASPEEHFRSESLKVTRPFYLKLDQKCKIKPLPRG